MEVHLTVAGGKGSGDVDRCGGSSPKVLPRRDGAGARARLFLLPACDPPRGRCPGGHRSVDPTLSRPGRVPAPVSAPLGSVLSPGPFVRATHRVLISSAFAASIRLSAPRPALTVRSAGPDRAASLRSSVTVLISNPGLFLKLRFVFPSAMLRDSSS